jgi:hypothetical protein
MTSGPTIRQQLDALAMVSGRARPWCAARGPEQRSAARARPALLFSRRCLTTPRRLASPLPASPRRAPPRLAAPRRAVPRAGAAQTTHEVVGRVELTGRTVINLEEDHARLKKVIEAQDDVLNQRILSECNNVRDDMNHKFALQVAENKRLQAQLAKAQIDVQRLTRIVENLATRTQILEANTGLA